MNQFFPRVKKLIRANHSARFILVFQGLLVVGAVFQILGNRILTEGVAVLAYFSLIIGVLRLIFLEKLKDEE